MTGVWLFVGRSDIQPFHLISHSWQTSSIITITTTSPFTTMPPRLIVPRLSKSNHSSHSANGWSPHPPLSNSSGPSYPLFGKQHSYTNGSWYRTSSCHSNRTFSSGRASREQEQKSYHGLFFVVYLPSLVIHLAVANQILSTPSPQ